MVQSARIQKLIKGDDVILTHQIMGDIAYNAEKSRIPIMLQTGDTAKAFYALQDSTQTDLIGYPCTPIGALPSSMITVVIAGIILVLNQPNRGTSMLQSGSGKTVRIEITRANESKETHYLINEVDIYERGFPSSLNDTSGGSNPPTELDLN